MKKGHEIIEIGVTHDRTEKQRTEAKRRRENRTSTENAVENFPAVSRGSRTTWASIVSGLH